MGNSGSKAKKNRAPQVGCFRSVADHLVVLFRLSELVVVLERCLFLQPIASFRMESLPSVPYEYQPTVRASCNVCVNGRSACVRAIAPLCCVVLQQSAQRQAPPRKVVRVPQKPPTPEERLGQLSKDVEALELEVDRLGILAA